MDVLTIKEEMVDDIAIDAEPIDFDLLLETQLDLKDELKCAENNESINFIAVKEELLEDCNSPTEELKVSCLQSINDLHAIDDAVVKNEKLQNETPMHADDRFLEQIRQSKWPIVLVHKMPWIDGLQSLNSLHQSQYIMENSSQLINRSENGSISSYHQLKKQFSKYQNPYGKSKNEFNPQRHLRMQSGEKRFKCKYCSYETARNSTLRRHFLIHSGAKPFKCDSCSFETAQKSNLRRHFRMHLSEKSFKCKQCSYATAVKTHLQSHLQIHSLEKRFKCTHCAYETARSSSLHRHLRIHSGVKPFKCEYCSFETSDKSNFQRHLRIHLGEKRFQCKLCSYATAGKLYLQRHFLLIHSDKKLLKCEHCSYETADKLCLRRHLQIHSGERPFKCEYCSYQTIRKLSLQNHLQIHFRENPLELNIVPLIQQ